MPLPPRLLRSGVALVPFVLACTSRPTELTPARGGATPELPSPRPAAPPAWRVATYNAGLAVGFIPRTLERAPRVVEALQQRSDLDLLCVQEFWRDAHWDQLTQAMAPRLPHTHRAPPVRPSASTCTTPELAPLRACLTQHCAGLSTDELGACVLAQCSSVAQQMSVGCVNCLLTDPVGSGDEITARCVRPAGAPEPRPSGGSSGIVPYGGSLGTGLLSSAPLLDRDTTVFPSTLNPRGALYARVTPPALGRPVHVFCTHFSPTNEQEQGQQVEQLLAWIGRKAPAGEPVVVLGDLNIGPAVGADVRAQAPTQYQRLLGAGLRNPYAEQSSAGCTFCRANPLNGGLASPVGTLIDHILLRNLTGATEVTRWLQEPLALPGAPTAYSDHYGIVLRLSPG